MKTDDLRKIYLDFFKKKDHRAFSSDSLVPADDPSLLFTGAGMNQFKPYFLGLKKDVKRATSCQKCLRTADLDRVGKTATHHSFFEMLGNFSFGDYFKEEAIAWGWEFVTKELKLPPSKLWVSVYEEDDEAFNIWKNRIKLSESRIVRMGAEDNFWPANAPKDGPNGPCGPCSEIYVGEIPGKGVEIWNLVFTQFDRQSDGSLKNLPQRNIDTGMGLERTAAVLQGAESNYDTDNFQKIRAELKKLLKSGAKEMAHENAVMDHIRAVVFSVADGALPSNEGRGYVIRKLIRLGSDHLAKAGVIQSGMLSKLVQSIVDVYGKSYPEIVDRQKMITTIIDSEERNFQDIVDQKFSQLVDEYHKLQIDYSDMNEIMAKTAELGFKYYDSYGMPLDLVKDAAQESGLMFNETLFDKHMEEQRKRSRAHSKIAGEIFSKNNLYMLMDGIMSTVFLGDSPAGTTGKLLRIISNGSTLNKSGIAGEVLMIFDQSTFYGESGGQVGDTGIVVGEGFSGEVIGTQLHERIILHKVCIKQGIAEVGKSYALIVDSNRRSDIMKNHTATHLLHSALRKVLGDHVKQSGSLVAPDRLRFDFTHFNALDTKRLTSIEDLVNFEIQKNIAIDKQEMDKEAAVKSGAIAFFGEKYGNRVRVVTIGDFSKELCGGTHLHSTGEIGAFKIISEGSIQAGVRRIEAVTGRGAEEFFRKNNEELEELTLIYRADKNSLPEVLKKLKIKTNDLQNRITNARNSMIHARTADVFQKSVEFSGAKIVTLRLPGGDSDSLKSANDYLKTLKVPYVAFLVSYSEGKVSVAISASADMVNKGFHSGKIVKAISSVVQGNGGGRPDFAIGGGKDTQKIDEAIRFGEKIIKEAISR